MRRESRAARRRRVMRNRIFLGLAIVILILIVVLIVVIVNNKQGNTDKTQETTGVTESDITSQTSSGEEMSSDGTDDATTVNDVTAPVITGEANIYVARNSKLKYKSYVKIKDDYDSDPDLEIDNSNVDLSKEGTYTVTYTATDASGNSSSKVVNVVVGAEEEPNVEESVIYAAADAILENIITDDMSDLDKVFAVFFYVRDTYTYVKDDNYWEYKQEAYHFIQTMQDNCYANVCLSRLLLERLGFESFMIQGELGYLNEHHYWNMVSIDGGNTWYHYDSAWWTWMYEEYPMCMMTDEFSQKISERHGGLLIYDHDAFPATPEEDLWTPEERGYTSQYE